MAKTDRPGIEKALRYYAPRARRNNDKHIQRQDQPPSRSRSSAEPTQQGMVDCVRINEYFGDKERTRVPLPHMEARRHPEDTNQLPRKGIADSDKTPELCDNDKCRWNIWKEVGRTKGLVQCFEIKIRARRTSRAKTVTTS